MTSHLLSLSVLHTTAPGVLDVVFGPDGDFEGAPRWTCPIATDPDRWRLDPSPAGRRWSIVGMVAGARTWPDDAALDLRIPSVAARLAGLCARALHHDGPVYCYQSADDGWWYLMPKDDNGALYWIEGAASEANFLAALTLALAPKIAALGGGR